MHISDCICGNKTVFRTYIKYKNETVFKDFEGIIIGKCNRCGMLKTFAPRHASFDPRESRNEMYEKKRDFFIPLFMPVVNTILRYKKSGKILDVGCSSGLLMELLAKNNFDVYGIEPNKNAYESARKKFGNRIHQGTLSSLNNKKQLFDVVIYNHVLEHIENPQKEIDTAKKSLKKNGILVIGVPNTANIIFLIRQKYWEPLMPKEHIWHFSKKHLTEILHKNGFIIRHAEYSDDKRTDYPFIKRIYFYVLSLINKLLDTGEAMIIIAQK